MTSKTVSIPLKNAILMALLMFSTKVMAQIPVISSVEPSRAAAGAVVTIAGEGFSADKTQLQVFFGSAAGTIVTSTTNRIDVEVPAGATNGPVTVTNLSSGLMANSATYFFLSYGGSAFDVNNLAAPVDLSSDTEIFDICLCDFDNDGLVDIGSASRDRLQVTIYRNNSSSNVPNFVAQASVNIPGTTKAVKCADLNGDGKPEILLTRADANSISFEVLQNGSSPGAISFTSPTVSSYVTETNNPINKLAVVDLDGNGLPEVVTTNENLNTLFIFSNESTKSTVALNSIASQVTIPNTLSSFDIEAVDLDRDLKKDLLLIPNNVADNVYYLKNNTSSRGNYSFEAVEKIMVLGQFRDLIAADLNNDNLTDFVVSSNSSDNITPVINTTTNGSLSFSALTPYSSTDPFSIDVGDLNGDGLGDIVAANLAGQDIKILLNTGTVGDANPTFSELTVSADAAPADLSLYYPRQVRVGDVTGDGKPDIVATTFDLANSKYNLSVIRNSNCLEPVLEPAGPLTVCNGQVITFTATPGIGVDYLWKVDGVQDMAAPNQHTYDYAVDGSSPKITVEVVSEGGACMILSNEVSLTFDAGIAPATPTLTDPSPTCLGENVTLNGPARAGATYYWRGPNGFTSSDQSPVLMAVTPDNAGEYFLAIQEGNCISDEASLFLDVINPPTPVISPTGAAAICVGQSSVLLEVDNLDNYTYQWFMDGGAISGATTPTYSASAVGSYTVTLTSTVASCVVTTPAKEVTSQPPPVAGITASTTGCVGESILFEDASSPTTGVTYAWDFAGLGASTEPNPTFIFDTPGSYDINLTVNIGDGTCQDIATHNIVIEGSPTVALSAPATELCAGDSLIIKATGTYSSITWSPNGETIDSIKVFTGGKYYATVTNAAGCEVADTLNITELPSPNVTITADPDSLIALGESVVLLASGGDTYAWSPTDSLDNPTIANPMANPSQTTTYTVEATGTNGCKATAQITVVVSSELTPRKVFSPNGDGMGEETWFIGGILNKPECTVLIFDRQGKKVFEQTNYQNTWDATVNGKELPEGPYYFIIKCENEVAETGSVLVVR